MHKTFGMKPVSSPKMFKPHRISVVVSLSVTALTLIFVCAYVDVHTPVQTWSCGTSYIVVPSNLTSIRDYAEHTGYGCMPVSSKFEMNPGAALVTERVLSLTGFAVMWLTDKRFYENAPASLLWAQRVSILASDLPLFVAVISEGGVRDVAEIVFLALCLILVFGSFTFSFGPEWDDGEASSITYPNPSLLCMASLLNFWVIVMIAWKALNARSINPPPSFVTGSLTVLCLYMASVNVVTIMSNRRMWGMTATRGWSTGMWFNGMFWKLILVAVFLSGYVR